MCFITFNALCTPSPTARRSAKRSGVRICRAVRPRTKMAEAVSQETRNMKEQRWDGAKFFAVSWWAK